MYRRFMRYLGNCCHNPSRLLVLTTTPQFHVRKIWAKKSSIYWSNMSKNESGRTLRYFPKSKGAIVHMAEKSPKLAMEGSSFAGKIIELADRGVRIWNGSPKPKGVIYGDVLPRLWKNVHRYIISQIYIYIYLHIYIIFTDISYIWVKYHISLKWILQPFGDDSPNPNHDSQGLVVMKFTQIYPLLGGYSLCHPPDIFIDPIGDASPCFKNLQVLIHPHHISHNIPVIIWIFHSYSTWGIFHYPLVNVNKKLWKITTLRAKSTISMGHFFNSKLLVYQRLLLIYSWFTY